MFTAMILHDILRDRVAGVTTLIGMEIKPTLIEVCAAERARVRAIPLHLGEAATIFAVREAAAIISIETVTKRMLIAASAIKSFSLKTNQKSLLPDKQIHYPLLFQILSIEK